LHFVSLQIMPSTSTPCDRNRVLRRRGLQRRGKQKLQLVAVQSFLLSQLLRDPFEVGFPACQNRPGSLIQFESVCPNAPTERGIMETRYTGSACSTERATSV